MRRQVIVLVLALAAAGWGCSKKATDTVAPVVLDPAPAPSSPAGAVRLLEWCWQNQRDPEYEGVFTDDYVFVFAPDDSAGAAYRGAPFEREDELRCAAGMFVGTPDRPAASDIKLDFDRTLIAFNDDRPGKNPRWHQYIRTSVDLQVTIESGEGAGLNGVKGYARFYLVRGDSAAIPPDLFDRGVRPDSTRWWIDRWEDETLGPWGSRANPAASTSWGRVKTLFR